MNKQKLYRLRQFPDSLGDIRHASAAYRTIVEVQHNNLVQTFAKRRSSLVSNGVVIKI